jgi:hypothetical protein
MQPLKLTCGVRSLLATVDHMSSGVWTLRLRATDVHNVTRNPVCGVILVA